ncbi:MAG: hypothetical protein HY078_10780 [Elusimicrobia bacterium]|nr:hypothetical protein [Elusimicrobiota bacterium]
MQTRRVLTFLICAAIVGAPPLRLARAEDEGDMAAGHVGTGEEGGPPPEEGADGEAGEGPAPDVEQAEASKSEGEGEGDEPEKKPAKKKGKSKGSKKPATKTAAPPAKKKKRKPSGYNYDESKYLAVSSEKSTYLFDADGNPVVKKKKGKKGKKSSDDETSSGDNSLGTAMPKKQLKTISFQEEEKKDKAKRQAETYGLPGNLPPGMLPGAGAAGGQQQGGGHDIRITP